MSRLNKPVQLTFEDARRPTGRGGWRPNAGRPKGRKTTPHDKRKEFAARYPLHVTWRLAQGGPYLRKYHAAALIREAIRAAQKASFRVVEYSIQGNHLHMIIEASGKRGLESGMRGLARRITCKLRTKLSWEGKLLTRYHARLLTTPREVRNALRYVLLNARHHAAQRGERLDNFWVDPYSSGLWFDGWSRPIILNSELRDELKHPRPTVRASSWLLAIGWRTWKLIELDEIAKH
jgi:REP element-mobilizing transposase RayT